MCVGDWFFFSFLSFFCICLFFVGLLCCSCIVVFCSDNVFIVFQINATYCLAFVE